MTAGIRVFVNGELRLEGSDPKHNPSGTVGFYVGGFSEFRFDDVKFTLMDRTAPVTSADVTPANPDGANGWYAGPVTVQLNGTDTGTGVTDTEYSTDGGGSWIPYQSPVTFSEDGHYSVLFRSVDLAGNREDAKTLSFKLDGDAPELSVAEPAARAYAGTETLTLSWTAADALSGVDADKTAARLDGQIVEQGTEIPLYTLALGPTRSPYPSQIAAAYLLRDAGDILQRLDSE